MRTNRYMAAVVAGVLFLGLVVFGPVSASASRTMGNQQALFLVHLPLGGGQFFTVNYTFTGSEAPTTVTVKCFNDSAQRIGPMAGVNVVFSAQGQVVQHTPTTLGVTTDALFSGGSGVA